MLQKIKLTDIVIIVLILVLFLQRCGGGEDTPVAPKVVRDTVWVNNTGSVITKPVVTNNIPYTVPVDRWNTEYLPDTSSIAKLVKQYEEIVRTLLATNIQKDSVKIDSIGHVYITDTVTSNMVKNRKVTWDLHYPIITTTITIPEPKKVQWFVGGAIQGEQGELVDQISAGLLIKNKKDQIFGGYVGLSTLGKFQFGLQSYWKIKIK